jgi:DNA replication protein DnaC
MYYAPNFLELDSLSAIAKLVEPEYQTKATKKLTNRLRSAHLLGCPQEVSNCVDSADRTYLPSGITQVLASLDFIESGLNVCVLGPSDSGKSYLAKALGISACTKYRVIYFHCEQFLESMVMLKERDYPKYQKQLKKACGQDLLILDDFLLHTLTDEREVKLLFEILEKRSEMRLSTFVCSQREPASWSSMILNDEVSANAILKRATKHYTVVIEPKSDT